MRMRSAALLAVGLVTCAAMAQPRMAPLRIDGLVALQALAVDGVVPAVVGRRLEIRARGKLLLSVQPWPSFLPQRFGPQTLAASRLPLPAGPVDRLSFTRPSEHRPWLVVGTGARPGTSMIGAWHLQREGSHWLVSDGAGVKRWRPETPLRLKADGACWCLYLLDARLPQSQARIAGEGEAQLGWAAQRSPACATPR